MNRDEARNNHRKFFDDLRGCRAGHVPAQRYVSTGNCRQCHSERYALHKSEAYSNVMHVNVPPHMREVFTTMVQSLGLRFVQKNGRNSDTLYDELDVVATAAKKKDDDRLLRERLEREHNERFPHVPYSSLVRAHLE